jgi:hypothetical protein
MYFTPNLPKAIEAGQVLATLVLSGDFTNQPLVALDAALFAAGTVNAYFADVPPDPTTQATTQAALSNEELALAILPPEESTQAVPLPLILLLAKRIICSL